MKTMRAIVALVLLMTVAHSTKAATFVVRNYTNMSVEINIYWRDSLKVEEKIKPWSSSKEYNTIGAPVQVINWWYKGHDKCYGADLRSIKSRLMVNKEFVILENGHYMSTLVNFPYMQTKDRARANWNCLDPSEESD